jgi:hypothetical protein
MYKAELRKFCGNSEFRGRCLLALPGGGFVPISARNRSWFAQRLPTAPIGTRAPCTEQPGGTPRITILRVADQQGAGYCGVDRA